MVVVVMSQGGEVLTLVDLSHNQLQKCARLSHLSSLVFLDLSSNLLTSIDGLQCLSALRVLLLGRNLLNSVAPLLVSFERFGVVRVPMPAA